VGLLVVWSALLGPGVSGPPKLHDRRGGRAWGVAARRGLHLGVKALGSDPRNSDEDGIVLTD
jgi:hypothetical protein